VIAPALAAGRHVLCDRFTDSTFAYQGYGRGVPLPLIAQVDNLATGGRVPDHTLLFDLPAAAARQRGRSPRRQGVDRLDAEDLAFYRRVREGFRDLAARSPGRFHVVDSSGSSAATFAQVKSKLSGLLLEEVPA